MSRIEKLWRRSDHPMLRVWMVVLLLWCVTGLAVDLPVAIGLLFGLFMVWSILLLIRHRSNQELSP